MIHLLITFFKDFKLFLPIAIIIYFALIELIILSANYIELRKNVQFKDRIIGKIVRFFCNLTTASGFYFDDINIFIKRKRDNINNGN